MDQAITFTISDLWNVILAICGGISIIAGAITVVVKVIQKAKKPNKEQDARIKRCEERLDAHERRLEDGCKRFDEERKRTEALEQNLKETTQMIIISLQALMAHAIDGNEIDKLKEAKRDLDEFLVHKV